jgi:hypothetical protein
MPVSASGSMPTRITGVPLISDWTS